MSVTGSHVAHRVLRARRIGCTGGGMKLRSENARFARCLGWALAGEDGLVIVTGGYKCDRSSPDAPSTDWSVAQGAVARLDELGVPHDARMETLLPDPAHDRAANVRFHVGKVVQLRNRSPQARRFCFVSASDVVVTFEGAVGTREIIDMGLAIDTPVLPLPFTGGVSAERWRDNEDIIREWFDIDDATAASLDVDLASASDDELAELAATVTRLLLRRLKRKCFVIMPFAEHHLPLYDEAIKPAIIEQGMTPVRSDRLNLAGNAVQVLRTAISACDCSVAVITGFNPNVMYELGLAHAQSKPGILLCQFLPGVRDLPDLPFDLGGEYVIGYGYDLAELRGAVSEVLGQLYAKGP